MPCCHFPSILSAPTHTSGGVFLSAASQVVEIRRYMRELFRALAFIHHGITHPVIHRDIKPANFLHDRPTGTFLLVDFGLAEVWHGGRGVFVLGCDGEVGKRCAGCAAIPPGARNQKPFEKTTIISQIYPHFGPRSRPSTCASPWNASAPYTALNVRRATHSADGWPLVVVIGRFLVWRLTRGSD